MSVKPSDAALAAIALYRMITDEGYEQDVAAALASAALLDVRLSQIVARLAEIDAGMDGLNQKLRDILETVKSIGEDN